MAEQDEQAGWRRASERGVLEIAGADAATFLQGLVSNDVNRAGPAAPIYAALLTPQGKYLSDFLIWRPAPERFLLEVDDAQAAGLAQRLGLYKLRANVTIAPAADAEVLLAWGKSAIGAAQAVDAAGVWAGPDPRAEGLALRIIAETAAATTALTEALGPEAADAASVWRRRQIAARVPLSGEDLAPGDGFLLEYEFERLAGVDFKKGCYVGQEVTARMKHKTELKKGLFRVAIEGPAPDSGAEVTADGKPAGRLGAVEAGEGLALLRKDRIASGPLRAGEAVLHVRH